jgi:two-component system sensor histidine kinase BaeS
MTIRGRDRYGPGAPPLWWPHNEPWPPRSARWWRQQRRARFVRRAGWYSFWPIWAGLWLLGSVFRYRPAAGSLPIPPGVVLLVVCGVAAGTVAVFMRWLAAPLADIASAADRIAHRENHVRVDEPPFGPAWVRNTARAFNTMAGQLDAQDEARRHLMAVIAHELRTPLAILQGKLEGLIDGVYPRDDDQLQALLDDTRVFARLVEDLRTLATSEVGAMALSKEPTDIVALANDVGASFAASANERGISLRVVTDSAREIELLAIDPVRIREVLMNLVTNALRYTPRGGRIEVAIAATATSVELRVVDTGPGIPESELARIFDRFYKGAGSTGSGLGLTIARNLVEAHGGGIRAESRLGSGTSMIVSLPR